MPYNPRQHIPEYFQRAGNSDRVISSNERELLRIVRRFPGISRAEMTDRTGLTQQSVYRLVEAMNARGMIVFGDPVPGTGRGQPSPTIRLNADYTFTAGISVNTDTIGICLFDFSGTVRSTEMVDIVDAPMSVGLERISASISRQIVAQNLLVERMFGTGFAISGFLQEGTTYNTPLPLHEWSLIELGPLISNLIDRPTWTGNSANTAAICEAMLGVGQHISNFAYLSFNFGFGGAAIINGELLRGGHGNAGELSAMYNDDEMAKRPALQFLLENLRQNGVDIPSIEYIRQHYDPSWPGVDKWINDIMPALNRVINAVYAVLDPQAIVFGGQIPKELATQLIANVEFSRSPRHGRLMKSPKVIVSELEGDASSVGAAVMPFKDVFF